MKKKILFLCSNMDIGGFQRSLISLLNSFDYNSYDIDLLLMKKNGLLSKYIPKNVNILKPVISESFYYKFPTCIFSLIKERKYKYAFFRFVGALISLKNKGRGFVFSNKVIPPIKDYYDVAIDYNGQQLLYYLVDKINADIKISFFHSDYKKWPYYKKTDEIYYDKVNYIVTVSDECVESMKDIFPQFKNKIYKIENIVSKNTIFIDSDTKTFSDEYDGTRLLTVARVCYDKGIDLAIKTIKILLKRGYYIKWYWIGPYDVNDIYIKQIENDKLQNNIILLGAVDNPYGFMRDADIIVHPSKFEGKSVTVEEAKILNIPIIATNYSTVKNQIENNKTGIIVDFSEEQLANEIIKLIETPEKRNELINNMKAECVGNDTEINKLYKLMNV